MKTKVIHVLGDEIISCVTLHANENRAITTADIQRKDAAPESTGVHDVQEGMSYMYLARDLPMAQVLKIQDIFRTVCETVFGEAMSVNEIAFSSTVIGTFDAADGWFENE